MWRIPIVSSLDRNRVLASTICRYRDTNSVMVSRLYVSHVRMSRVLRDRNWGRTRVRCGCRDKWSSIYPHARARSEGEILGQSSLSNDAFYKPIGDKGWWPCRCRDMIAAGNNRCPIKLHCSMGEQSPTPRGVVLQMNFVFQKSQFWKIVSGSKKYSCSVWVRDQHEAVTSH